jgi:threonine/homoserine/homoserine lactone efflux protein
MSLANLLLFGAVAFVAIATPGPTTLLALSNGSRYGLRRACWGMGGAVVSDLVLVAAAGLGMGALLAASEFWFSVVKWVGVAYLAWLGLQLLRSPGRPAPAPTGDADAGMAGRAMRYAPGSRRAVFMRCFLVAVTNPKGYLFVSAFLPQFVVPSEPQAGQYVILALAFAGIDFAVMFAYALAGSRAVRLLRGAGGRIIDRTCGGLMVAAAGSAVPELSWLFFAIAQFPISLLPAMLKPLARRVAPQPPA